MLSGKLPDFQKIASKRVSERGEHTRNVPNLKIEILLVSNLLMPKPQIYHKSSLANTLDQTGKPGNMCTFEPPKVGIGAVWKIARFSKNRVLNVFQKGRNMLEMSQISKSRVGWYLTY